jgi:hypothetical protein
MSATGDFESQYIALVYNSNFMHEVSMALLVTFIGLPKYGCLEDFSLAFVLLFNNVNQFSICSSARILANRCCAFGLSI